METVVIFFYSCIFAVYLVVIFAYVNSKSVMKNMNKGMKNRPNNTAMLQVDYMLRNEIYLNGELLKCDGKISCFPLQIGDVLSLKNESTNLKVQKRRRAIKITENELKMETLIIAISTKHSDYFLIETHESLEKKAWLSAKIFKLLMLCTIVFLSLVGAKFAHKYKDDYIYDLDARIQWQTYVDHKKILQENCDQIKITECSKYDGIYPEGEYLIGNDIESGQYFLIQATLPAFYELNGDKEYVPDYQIIELSDGDQLIMDSDSLLINQDIFKPTPIENFYSEGEYIIGKNIDPGTYKIIGSDNAYYYLGPKKPVEDDFIKITDNNWKSETVELKEGDYFYLENTIMKKVDSK